MTRLTVLQKNQLNRSNESARRASLGTRVDALEFGSAISPPTGTVTPYRLTLYETAPAIGATDAVLDATLLVQTVTQDIATGLTDPDYPRTLTITGGDANVSGDVVISGTNILDEAIEDTIASNGVATVEGVMAFKTVTNINLPPYSVAGTETIKVGTGNSIGFPVAIPNASLVKIASFNLTVDTSGTVFPAATVEESLYIPNGTLNGTALLQLWFLSA